MSSILAGRATFLFCFLGEFHNFKFGRQKLDDDRARYIGQTGGEKYDAVVAQIMGDLATCEYGQLE